MYCQKCGAQSADESKFCESCGAPMFAAAQTPAPQPPAQAYQPSYQPPYRQQAKSGSNNVLILGIVGILVAAVAALTVFLILNSQKKGKEQNAVTQSQSAPAAQTAPAATTTAALPQMPPQAPPAPAAQGGGFDGSLLDQINSMTFGNQPLRSSSLPMHTSTALSGPQWRIARNGVYARHGRPFQALELNHYFYELRSGVYKMNSAYSDSMLTATDRDNIEYLKKLENGGGGAPAPAAKAQSLGSMSASLEDCLWTVIEGERLQGSSAPCQTSGALSKANWRILRNAAYARHGRPFKDKSLNKFFYGDGPYAQNPDYTDSLLTATDRANIAYIQQLENGAR